MRRNPSPILLLVLLALVWPALPAAASGVVTECDEAHLLEALAGGGTVSFACSGTITLASTITIAADTTVDGSGQNVTLSGNNMVRVLAVSPGVTLTLDRLAIANGRDADSGGGISNAGTLIVSNSTFSGNSAYSGGGIYNNGSLEVSSSIFSDNDAGAGAGIFNGGTLSVSSSIFSDNDAGAGAGIRNNSSMSVSNSTFSGNRGGGISSGGTLSVSKSAFLDNSANYGGGISNSGSLGVYNSTFSGNTATSWGGGILSSSDHLYVGSSTFSGNSANLGGGIYTMYTTSIVDNSTFSNNNASDGGGIVNVSVPGPPVPTCKSLSVTYSTFSGSSIYAACETSLTSTIVVSGSASGTCSGAITDGGWNLSYPGSTCPGIHADPILGPLQDNGGPTQTMALGLDSPARDAAAAHCHPSDQRGFPRPAGSHCDIGAYEAATVAIDGPSAGHAGTSYAFTATVSPVNVTLPITYTWVAAGQAPVTNTLASLTDTRSFAWSTPGSKAITVTITGAGDTARGTHTIHLTPPLPSVALAGPTRGHVGTSDRFAATVSPISVTLPITYAWEATGRAPVIHAGAGVTDTMDFAWSTPGSKTITVTVTNAEGTAASSRGVEIRYPLFLPVVKRP